MRCQQVIVRSFKTCGLTTNLDGTEDHEIPALKNLDIFEEIQERHMMYPAVNIGNEVNSIDESIDDISHYVQTVINVLLFNKYFLSQSLYDTSSYCFTTASVLLEDDKLKDFSS